LPDFQHRGPARMRLGVIRMRLHLVQHHTTGATAPENRQDR
jgi:hypothetical protein